MLHCRMHGVVAECMELLRNAWISCGMHEIPVGDFFQKNALFFFCLGYASCLFCGTFHGVFYGIIYGVVSKLLCRFRGRVR